MIVDTSALIAILLDESEGAKFSRLIEGDPAPKVSAGTYLETGIVFDARSGGLPGDLDTVLIDHGVSVVAMTAAHAALARAAYGWFGKGTGHPARLNFGDCLSCALAIDASEPLLFTGEDFRHTDVRDARVEARPG